MLRDLLNSSLKQIDLSLTVSDLTSKQFPMRLNAVIVAISIYGSMRRTEMYFHVHSSMTIITLLLFIFAEYVLLIQPGARRRKEFRICHKLSQTVTAVFKL